MLGVRPFVLLVAGLLGASDLCRAQSAAPTGTLVGLVTDAQSGAPLAYSIVSIPTLKRERLTDDRGQVALTTLPAGSAELLVRHLGYTPARVAVTVHAGGTDTVRVRLARLAVQLTAVQVRGQTCTKPGAPDGRNPTLAAVYEQMQQNAVAYRLLSEAYPFVYDLEREASVLYVGGDMAVMRRDTMRIGTGTRWHYAPGAVVDRVEMPGSWQVGFNIPALIHFAEPAFAANHCFSYGGMDTADGSPAIRLDIAAAARIRTPDVDGSVYLDPATYQIRRSVLHLTRIPEETPEIRAVTVTTEFRPIVASISIAASISSVHLLFADTTRPILPRAAYERQRLLRVTFLGAAPPGAKTPSAVLK